MVWGNKTFWITKQQCSCSQDLPSALVRTENVFSELGSFKLSRYLPISDNSNKIIDLNSLLSLSWLIHKFALLQVIGCLFPRKSRKSGPHRIAAWISRFINKLIRIRFIPFWMNIIKKELFQIAMVELEYFPIFL